MQTVIVCLWKQFVKFKEEKEMIKKLLRCVQCDEVVPDGGIFGAIPSAEPLPGVEWSDEDLEIWKEFFRIHQGHPLEELRVNHDTIIGDKPDWEAIKTTTFEASNGRQNFRIKRTKTSLDRPAVYELISALDWDPDLAAACYILSS